MLGRDRRRRVGGGGDLIFVNNYFRVDNRGEECGGEGRKRDIERGEML